MPEPGTYADEAKRFKEEIRRRFKTQVALCQAIGAKDSSYLTAYVTGRNRIGNILRERLEAVGVDVNYILYGRQSAEERQDGVGSPEALQLLVQCTGKVMQLQDRVLELSRELLEVNKLLETAKKSMG